MFTMKKLLGTLIIGLTLTPFLAYAHTICQSRDLFNTQTGASCATSLTLYSHPGTTYNISSLYGGWNGTILITGKTTPNDTVIVYRLNGEIFTQTTSNSNGLFTLKVSPKKIFTTIPTNLVGGTLPPVAFVVLDQQTKASMSFTTTFNYGVTINGQWFNY